MNSAQLYEIGVIVKDWLDGGRMRQQLGFLDYQRIAGLGIQVLAETEKMAALEKAPPKTVEESAPCPTP